MAGTIRLDSDNWYRLEGYVLPKDKYEYTSFNLSALDAYDIWYTNVEVRLQNPSSTNYVHGINYKIRTFSEYGLNNINDIADNFSTIYDKITSDIKNNEGALTYSEPFIVSESSIICFNDAYQPSLTRTIVILKDDYLTSELTGISAIYDGPTIAVDEEFMEDFLNVTGIYNDGHTSRLTSSTYNVIRKSDNKETKVINTIGANQFTATVKYKNNNFEANFVVIGVKRLVKIKATYDGPNIALNKNPLKRDFIVCAEYSDGSISTVTDWSFLNGNTITEVNKGTLTIYYLGLTCDVYVKHYKTDPTQIKAYYNGPNVEKGKDFLLEYLTVKIYYQNTSDSAGNAYWETLTPGSYNVNTQHISIEGDNIITVTYETVNKSILTTTFIITGIISKAYIGYITAEYSGPPVAVGKHYNNNYVTVKAYWSNGDVSTIKGFNVNNTKITQIGDNTFIAIYKQKTCEFVVIGAEVESTSETNYNPTQVDLKYPEASKLNHRYRGPMESLKFDEYNKFVFTNINNLFDIYNSLEKTYNAISTNSQSLFNIGTKVLGTVSIIEDKVSYIKNIKKGENNE